MGKVTKFTGSKLLGAELRRLRSGRSLKQIVELSKTPPLSERIAPVAAPTLSQIENGISFPSLETIHSLALLYRRPVQQLLDLVVQERLLEATPDLGTADDAPERFRAALAAGRWHEALALAIQAESVSKGAAVVQWRANRAQVLRVLGMTHDAIDLLEECLENRDLRGAGSLQMQVHQALADVLAWAGLATSARLHLRAAFEAAPSDLPEAQRRALLRSRAYLTLLLAEESESPDERELREALRGLDEALDLTLAEDTETRGLILVHRAGLTKLLGNHPVAARDLERVAAEAEAAGQHRVRQEALAALGVLHRQRRRTSSAVRCLEEAARLAVDMGDRDLAFAVHFELYRAVEVPEPEKARHYLQRCERFYPFVRARTPNVVRFEALTREA